MDTEEAFFRTSVSNKSLNRNVNDHNATCHFY